MEIEINERNDSTIIKFNKDKLLGTEAAEFQNSVIEILEKGVKSIVIDLSSVIYLTSWAIGMLVHAFTTATNRGAQLSLSGVTQRVRDILSKVKLDKIFSIQ
ncbi:MAG TPA: STAS domain-containing protein [Ignavibacteriaceae bacterium]|jgi:anti-sigma B factor antagonist|nr:STAS domain-containing protein [Ignavibacteriaceae bacterium]